MNNTTSHLNKESDDIPCFHVSASSHHSQSSAGNSGGSGGAFCTGRLDGSYANPNDPHSFYVCSHGATFYKTCPANLVFSNIHKVCVWPQNIDPFCAGKADGNYINPNNRNSFYMCSNGLTYIQNCQPGLVYNQACNCCNYS